MMFWELQVHDPEGRPSDDYYFWEKPGRHDNNTARTTEYTGLGAAVEWSCGDDLPAVKIDTQISVTVVWQNVAQVVLLEYEGREAPK